MSSNNEPTRWIWQNNEAKGPYSVDKLYRMAMRAQINHESLFWSEVKKAWQPLPGLLFDIYPEQIEQIVEVGIAKIQVLDCGNGDDCPACLALANKIFPPESPPELPPVGCTCIPWCRLTVIASFEQ